MGQCHESDEGSIATKRDLTKQRLLAAIVDCSEDAIFSSTPAGILLSWNRGAEAIFGYKAEDAIGKHVSMLMATERLPDLAYFVGQVSQGVTVSQYESLCRRKNGRVFQASVTGSPLINSVGEVRALAAILRDISKQKDAEDALIESEGRFRVMADGCPAVMWVTNAEGGIQFINRAYRELVGRTFEETEGHKWQMALHPEDSTEYLGAFQRAVRDHTAFRAETRARRADGEWRWMVSYGEPRFSAHGKFLGQVGLSLDITERKRMEDALRQSDESHRRQFADNSVAMLLLDPADGRVIEANDAAVRFYGYPREQLQRMCASDIGTRSASEIRQALAVVPRESGQLVQSRHRLADGSVRDVEVSTTQIQSGERSVLHTIVFDITARKRAEEALQKREVDLNRALAMARVGHWSWDVQNHSVSWSAEMYRIYGVTPEAFDHTTDGVAKLIHPHDLPRRTRAFESILQGRAFDPFEYRVLRPDGSVSHVYVFAAEVERDDSGRPIRVFGADQDITERKRAEEALEESGRLLSESQRVAHVGSWSWDLATDAMAWTPELYSVFGVSLDTFVPSGEALLSVIHPDDRAAMQAWIGACMAGEEPPALEFRVCPPDGSLRYIHGRGSLVRDAENKPVRITGIGQDITERKQAEETLRESEAQNLALIKAFPDLLFRIHRGGEFLAVHASHPEILFAPPETFLHRKIEEILPKPLSGRFMKALTNALDSEAVQEVDYTLPIGGEERHYEARVTCCTKDTVLTVVRDVTERKQAERELHKTNRQLEEATARAETATLAKSEFLANMSHEIRTPMNGVIGMTGLLLDTELNDEQRRYAGIVRASGESLLGVINDILDFSKIEAKKLDLETLDFDLDSLLEEFAATLAARAYEKELELICAADPAVPTLLRGDPSRLRQILTNLAGNAVKFTQTGEVAVRVSLEEENETECRLRFSVRDTGIGIPEDKIGMLFAKFSQVDTSTTRKYGGTGLGLAISKQLAELMGGEVGVESREGQGSEFWFTARLGKQPEGARTQPHPSADLGGVRALIVDDNATSREILTTRMTTWGMRPSETGDGPAALQALARAIEENDPFRVAVIDMQMPEMDGEALGRAIQGDRRLANTRMVMLTSLGMRGDARRLEEIGFAAYATKPIQHQELMSILSLALAERDETQPTRRPIATRHEARETLNPFVGRKARILVVEDNIVNQHVALGILKKFGLRADAVADGAEAVEALENIPYDLVLMDVQMPVMDGFEAARQIRNPQSQVRHHAIPIIAMTAHAMQGDRARCLEAGMNDYVSKPVSPRALAEALANWLPKKNDALAPVVFDRAGMLERLMHDEDLARVVTENFLDDAPRQIQALRGYIEAWDAPGAERQAHTLRGASSKVGAEALRALAFEMEKAGEAGDLDSIRTGMDQLEREFARLKEAMVKEP